VHPRERVVGIERMIELGVEPVRRRVTSAAVVGQAELHMRRIVAGCVVAGMAGVAGGRSSREDIVGVTGGAGKRGVRSGERVAGDLEMVEPGVEPRVHGVTRFAGCGESCGDVIENLSLKVLLVTGIAGSGEARELAGSGVLMTVVALQ